MKPKMVQGSISVTVEGLSCLELVITTRDVEIKKLGSPSRGFFLMWGKEVECLRGKKTFFGLKNSRQSHFREKLCRTFIFLLRGAKIFRILVFHQTIILYCCEPNIHYYFIDSEKKLT